MQNFSHQPDLEDTPMGRLYQRHWQTLFILIHQSVSSREDAEDILLDVFLAAMESRALLNMNEQHQQAWLRRVAFNKSMDFHRRTIRRPTSTITEHVETLYSDESFMPEQIALRQEELIQLLEHLTRLSADQQKILRLRFADDLPCAQIAARVHKSEGAIRAMLARSLNRLRSIYAKQRKEHPYD
jgi:RNA polymerase sigma-70 factor (ECF subfamily)